MPPDRAESGSVSSLAPVAIVGAGPVGLSLALGLARQGVRSVLLERKATTSERSKAPGIHTRTREIFRQWGVEERFVEAGFLLERLVLHDATSERRAFVTTDFSALASEADRPGILMLEQGRTEKLLLEAVRESGLCEVRFGAEVEGIEPGEHHVGVAFREDAEERSLSAAYVVGCDGANSFVRNALGLPFDGFTYSLRPMLADVRVTDARDALPWPRILNHSSGFTFALRLSPRLWRIIHIQRDDPAREEVSGEEVRDLARGVLGPGAVEPIWANRFRIHRRSSPRFRVGRVLLAGDAAHVHSPVGAMGMNAGVQDAHNLAWKLATALAEGDADGLLDSYDVERRAVVVKSISRFTDFNTRTLMQTPPRVRAAILRFWNGIVRVHALRKRILRRVTMLDLDYPPSPLLSHDARSAGVRLPNPLLRAPDGTAVRLYDLLPYRPVILAVGEAQEVPADAAVEDVIRIGPDGYRDPSGRLAELLGGRNGWIIVRPDAHVAWAGNEPHLVREAAAHALGRG